MLSPLSKRVLARIQEHEWLHPGDRVGVAVSGGADSVALLLLLLELRERLGIPLSAVHFNHKLRGKDSDADERFVSELALQHGLEFHLKRCDVATKAKREKRNLEDMGRKERYAFFAGLAKEGRMDRVAVAHTADDQAETVLSHILRGTGIAGLGGIHPEVGCVIRPLLTIRRAELRDYLRLSKQRWREDATNRDVTRMRARIRRKLLPLMEKEFQGAVVEHLVTLADLARMDEAYLDALARDRAAKLCDAKPGRVRIRITELMPDGRTALSGRIIRRIAGDLRRALGANEKGHGGQLNADHVQAILRLANRSDAGKSLPLPGGILVRREHDALTFLTALTAKPALTGGRRRRGSQDKGNGGFSASIDLNAKSREIRLAAPSGCVFRFRVIDWPAKRGETNLSGVVLDRDRLRFPLLVRNWRPGDRLRLQGYRTARKLKRLLSEKHVSRWEREGWPVLVSDGAIVWARGFPVAAGFGVSEGTRAGLEIVEEQVS